jgi:uncharacterized ubiquitin-like protein YukD
MKKNQKLIIALLVVFFVAVLVAVGVVIWPSVSSTLFPPIQIVYVMPVSNTQNSSPVASPTERPTSTEPPTPTIRIKKPTWTPYPSITPWPSPAPLATLTPIPLKIAATSIPIHVKPDCSAQYNYIEAIHKYYLDYINYTYDLQISSYQPLLQQALRENDALTIIQIQEEVNQIKAQRDAAIKSENTRYAADIASLNAQCR